MKSYKLIKEYPGSDSLGTIITGSRETMYSKGLGFRNYDWAHVETHPEYWEEVLELDYEVTQVLYATEIRFAIYGEYRISRQGLGFSLEYLLASGGKIHSVKRLSDGEVFTVGDRVRVTECGSIKTVDSIAVENISTFLKNGAWILYNTGVCHLDGVTKVKQPIFLTHDGKDIFEGDKVWWVNKKTFCSDYFVPTPSVTSFSDINAYFLTREAAEDYIRRNKILFITEDGVEIRYGNTVWWVTGNNVIHNVNRWTGGNQCYESNKYFSTKQAAEDYVEKNKGLFTTDDGVEVREGDMIYVTNIEGSYKTSFYIDEWRPQCDRKSFSTEQALDKYILNNKPAISIKEFWEISSMRMSNTAVTRVLEELVKNRIC